MNRQIGMFDPPPAPPPPRRAQENKAAPDTPMEDHWPPNRLTPAAMRAYKRAEDEGLIRVEKITVSRSTGAATVRYLSTIPVAQWTREALKEYKEGAGHAPELER